MLVVACACGFWLAALWVCPGVFLGGYLRFAGLVVWVFPMGGCLWLVEVCRLVNCFVCGLLGVDCGLGSCVWCSRAGCVCYVGLLCVG